MTYRELSDVNTTPGVHTLFVYVAEIEPIFVPLFLFSFFIILLLASYFSQRRLMNKADFPSSFAVAGYATFMLALAMSLIEGLISPFILTVTVVISIAGTVWLFLPKED